MAAGLEELRIEITDVSQRKTLVIALDEDEDNNYFGIRIDIESAEGGGDSFWVLKKEMLTLYNLLKEKIIPQLLLEARKPSSEIVYKVVEGCSLATDEDEIKGRTFGEVIQAQEEELAGNAGLRASVFIAFQRWVRSRNSTEEEEEK